ncbi:MAG: protein kinase [Myxococcales bacterium]|nr:protein kinase [Myxococcales bacterium]MCB9577807.1 protein kinase [Polyangiaceae bacterium]
MEEPDRVCSKCGESYAADVIFCPKDGTPLGSKKTEVADDPYIGLELAGQLTIQQLIGIGAMGRVYRAHQRGIERAVAVKILHRELLRNPTVMSRFVREAKVASRLTHPNVVQVLMTGTVDKASSDVGGEAYLAMEYLDGISLRSALAAAGGAMPLPRALHVVLQVCDAVGEAHAQGIVHRDLKPENVMLVRRGDDPDFVKVLDFGVARIDWADSTVATQAGVIFGTARYISPEGAQGKTVVSASDVYSIAVMLFQCLSGETPFDADNPVGILIKHTNEPAPDIRGIARSSYVPEPIARVIAGNLVKNPEDRCRDARELGRALLSAARDSGISPDSLVARSTLLGQAALGLASIQRTKSLALTPELADRMAGKSPTVVNAPETLIDEPTSRPSAPSAPPVSEPAPSRPASVEPTMSDAPADSLRSSPTPTVSDAPVDSLRSSHAPASVPSLPPPEWVHGPASPWRRILVIAACFVLGAGLTVLVAQRLGAFAPPEPGVESYAARARRAMAVGAYDAPEQENVRDITDTALRRWPDANAIVAVRREAAKKLVLQAERDRPTDRERALSAARLAQELDPANDAARALVDKLAAPLPSAEQASTATPAPTPRRPSAPHPTPAPSASVAEPEDAGAPAKPATSATGGRWL